MIKLLKNIFSKPSNTEAKIPQNTSAEISPFAVNYDNWGIRTAYQGEEHESVPWQDITQVVIQIEDEFLPSPYWYLGGKDRGVRIPNNAVGAEKLFFQGLSENLPEYSTDHSYRTIIEAMGALEGIFLVWRRVEAEVER